MQSWDEREEVERTSVRWLSVFRDIQFWVPMTVLLTGVLLLSLVR